MLNELETTAMPSRPGWAVRRAHFIAMEMDRWNEAPTMRIQPDNLGHAIALNRTGRPRADRCRTTHLYHESLPHQSPHVGTPEDW